MTTKRHHYDVARSAAGGVIPNATVSVFLAGTTTLATVYASGAGAPKSNPLTADDHGFFEFFADQGHYKIRAERSGFEAFEVDNVEIGYAFHELGDLPVVDAASATYGGDLQAAVTDGAGGIVLLRATTYSLPSTLTIPDNTIVRGAGLQNTKILRAFNTARLVTMGAGSRIEDLTLDGAWDTVASHAKSEVLMAPDSLALRVRVRNFWYQGIAANGAPNARIWDSVVVGNNDGSAATGGAEFGIWCDNAGNTGLSIRGCHFADMRTVAIWLGGVNVSVLGCFFKNNHIQVTPVTGGQLGVAGSGKNVVIGHNVFEAGGAGASGIETGPFGSEDILIFGNTVDDQPKWGIILQDPQVNVQVVANRVEGCGQDGIRVLADHNDFAILNNRVRECAGWGIKVDAGTSDNYIIQGNDCRGNTAGPISDGGTGTNKIVKDNLPAGIGVARVTRSTTQSITSGSNQALSWDTEDYDYGGLWEVGNPTRLTAPVNGFYSVSGGVDWAASATGTRQLRIKPSSGSAEAAQRVNAASSGITYQSVATIVKLAAGAYVELEVQQDTGGPINANSTTSPATFFAMSLIAQY